MDAEARGSLVQSWGAGDHLAAGNPGFIITAGRELGKHHSAFLPGLKVCAADTSVKKSIPHSWCNVGVGKEHTLLGQAS